MVRAVGRVILADYLTEKEKEHPINPLITGNNLIVVTKIVEDKILNDTKCKCDTDTGTYYKWYPVDEVYYYINRTIEDEFDSSYNPDKDKKFVVEYW